MGCPETACRLVDTQTGCALSTALNLWPLKSCLLELSEGVRGPGFPSKEAKTPTNFSGANNEKSAPTVVYGI